MAKSKKQNSSASALLLIIIILIFGIWAFSKCSGPSSDTSSNDTSSTDTSQTASTAFKLASLEIGHNDPSQDLVKQFDDILDKLEKKCPDEDRSLLGNYIFKAQTMIAEQKGENLSMITIGNALDESIPEETAGVVSCAEIMAVFVTLYNAQQ